MTRSSEVTPYPKAPQPKPRKPRGVKPMSDKRRADLIRREKCRETVEARDGYRCWAVVVGFPHRCGTFGDRQDLELHETTPRGRDSLAWLDPDKCRLVCPRAHEAITSASGDGLVLARAFGLDVPAGPVAQPLHQRSSR